MNICFNINVIENTTHSIEMYVTERNSGIEVLWCCFECNNEGERSILAFGSKTAPWALQKKALNFVREVMNFPTRGVLATVGTISYRTFVQSIKW